MFSFHMKINKPFSLFLIILIFIQITNLVSIRSCSSLFNCSKQTNDENDHSGSENQAYDHSHESDLVPSSTVIVDLNSSEEEMQRMQILWIRNIKRIQMQVIHSHVIGNGNYLCYSLDKCEIDQLNAICKSVSKSPREGEEEKIQLENKQRICHAQPMRISFSIDCFHDLVFLFSSCVLFVLFVILYKSE